MNQPLFKDLFERHKNELSPADKKYIAICALYALECCCEPEIQEISIICRAIGFHVLKAKLTDVELLDLVIELANELKNVSDNS